jgi:hypothetical protein
MIQDIKKFEHRPRRPANPCVARRAYEYKFKSKKYIREERN